MELYFLSKLNIGVFLITAIIIAGILIWAKTFVFDAAPERDPQTIQAEIFDAGVVNTVYTGENDYYIIVVEAGKEDVPENRFKIKVDEPRYKVGDNVSIKTCRQGNTWYDIKSKPNEKISKKI